VRVLVAAMPMAGHVQPMAAVATELIRRGHEVVAYTGAKYGPRFAEVGATWLPWEQAPDFEESDLSATFPDVSDGRGPKAVVANLEHVFLRTGDGQARDLLAAGPFDLLVSDQLAIGPSLVAEKSGTPWATVAISALALPGRDVPPMGFALLPARGPAGRVRDAVLRRMSQLLLGRRLDAVATEVRASLDLPPARTGFLESFYSPQLVLAHGVPELEYPRTDLPPQVHFVGHLAPPPSGRPLPPWWSSLPDDRPLVHVTQGTYDVEPSDLLLPALAGLADAEVTVAAATGGAELPADRVPVNAHQAAFLPYDSLLPRTSVVVTNGGWGGVLASLAAGVPLVVAGGTLDKPELARRVAYSGAGLDLRTGRPKPAAVRAAVERVLAEPSFTERARVVGESLARHGGAATAADLLERLAETRAPVRRDEEDPWTTVR
jgi:UDP:flavonoid glycosyltransferase YjiC (YdhE family)